MEQIIDLFRTGYIQGYYLLYTQGYILLYIFVMSVTGFVLMGIDKGKARRNAWRIPERTLLAAALLGGGIGCLLGMYTFRHKTKHRKFRILLPLTAVLYAVICVNVISACN